MFDNTLHIPLRFYSDLEKQDRFKSYATTRKFTQYTDSLHLPEFQVRIPFGEHSFSIKLVNASTDLDDTYTFGTGWSNSVSINEYSVSQISQIVYDRTHSLSPGLPAGDFYLKITAGSDVVYSEVFTVGDIADKTILVWQNTVNDLGGIIYNITPAYKNSLIFDCVLAKPEYIIEEEAVEDGDGNQIPTFQRSVKLYKFWFYGPEYIADALSLVSLHDTVTLTTHYGMPESETGTIYDFAMTAEWQESKGLAKITCEFRDSPIIKTTCANNLA